VCQPGDTVPGRAWLVYHLSVTLGTLVFLSYGAGAHVAEAEYAILSAWRASRGSPIRLLLYTDTPARYDGLPVDIRMISAAELEAWQGPGGYHHRRKAEVIRDALRAEGHPIAFVDSDTWFRKPASQVFDRIAPGQVALHLLEGRLLDSNSPDKHALSRHVTSNPLVDLRGQPLTIDANAAMWNSGVAGIHTADANLLDESLNLIDQIWVGYQGSHDVEQFALGQVAERRARIVETSDIVYHYWPKFLRDSWKRRLPDLLAATATLPLDERADVLHHERPRARGKQLMKYAVKQGLRAAGRPPTSVRSSAT